MHCPNTQQRFQSFNVINSRFGFLIPTNLASLTDDALCKAATDFSNIYERDVSTDIVGQLLSLRACSIQLKALKSPRDVLKFIVENKLQSMLSDVVTAYMLYLTLSVTVATCERSFSKLRLIKNYLRSSCGQDQLSNLSLLSIESNTARELDMDDLINDFASKKARRLRL